MKLENMKRANEIARDIEELNFSIKRVKQSTGVIIYEHSWNDNVALVKAGKFKLNGINMTPAIDAMLMSIVSNLEIKRTELLAELDTL